MTETPILQAIRKALAATGDVMLYRNSVGFDDRLKIKYGFGKGSPDLCGLLRPSGRFVGFEVKVPKTGRLSDDQCLWHAAAKAAGAFVAVVRNPEDALAALERAKAGANE